MAIDNHVVSLDLAKKLKELGYPQADSQFYWVRMYDNEWKILPRTNYWDGYSCEIDYDEMKNSFTRFAHYWDGEENPHATDIRGDHICAAPLSTELMAHGVLIDDRLGQFSFSLSAHEPPEEYRAHHINVFCDCFPRFLSLDGTNLWDKNPADSCAKELIILAGEGRLDLKKQKTDQ